MKKAAKVGCLKIRKTCYAPALNGREVKGAVGVVRHETAGDARRHAKAILQVYGPGGCSQ